mgnify:FL=1
MNAKLTSFFRVGCFAVAGALALAGCNDTNKSADSGSGSNAKPMKAPDKMGGSAAPKAQQSASTQQPRKTEAPTKVDPATAPPKTSTVSTAPPKQSETTAQPAAATDDQKRAQAEDLIYAQIRVKMEEAIQKRAGLLQSGRAPSDTEVRQLEGVIMRARQLLTEAGEVVEDVQPPIVQSAP